MVNISLLLPTRNRLKPLYRLFDSIVETTAHPESLEIVLYIDEDDMDSHGISYPSLPIVKLIRARNAMGKVTNVCYEASHGQYIMLMNDDVIFRTRNWDTAVMEAARRFRDDIVLIYGNDLYQKHSLAAFPILPHKTCELMGRICPSEYEGGFIDPHIFDIFKRLAMLGHDRIVYLQDVVFEHMIPSAAGSDCKKSYTGRASDFDELLYIAWSEERLWIANRIAQYIESHQSEAKDSHAKNISAGKRVTQTSKSVTVSFSFGENWLKFVKSLDHERYEEARESFCDLLKTESLDGKSFLDVGCGSGIFSLAAIKLGAKKVVSTDVDPKSINACNQVKKKCEAVHWEILKGSILDKNFTQTLGIFDIVYSWGVLHHTGAMWEAIGNAANLVNHNGLLVIAIYNRTKTSNFWLKFKRLYNKSGKLAKNVLVWSIFLPRIMVRLFKLKHPLKEKRGMSVYYDAIDWAGGLPYEFASFEEICSYLDKEGFRLRNSKRTESTGCNEFVFEKKFINQ